MFCDYHVHTYYSDDSQYAMEEVIKDAIALGIEEVCFTDHVDYGIKVDVDSPMAKTKAKNELNVNYPLYVKEIKDLQKKYGHQITIKQGMEFGVQVHTIPQYETLFNAYHFDFIILSIHQVKDKEFWTNDFQKGCSESEYYQAYYQEMFDVVRNFHKYSVLGHMDLMKRYDDHDGYDSFHHHKAMIADILKYIIKDGKGIELNTSFLRYGLEEWMPSKEILKLYYALGGRILTIGSDSHQKEHLGKHIEELKKELKTIGFTKFCTYEKMRPYYHDL